MQIKPNLSINTVNPKKTKIPNVENSVNTFVKCNYAIPTYPGVD
ncbi:hypothetical protein GCM10007086_29590 [Photobacterium aphoticum]|nr:hypothetical protein GCM10007086_29590 [Photobacterium aphoticum]